MEAFHGGGKVDYPGQRRSQGVFLLGLQSVAQKTYWEHESFIIFGRSAQQRCMPHGREALTWTGQG
jgi:hypothetical protein